jgi:spectinomycin phosphotransferase
VRVYLDRATVIAVRSSFERVAESVIVEAIVEGWGIAVRHLEYFPEGGGAYHWVMHAERGGRWFVTCDDLDTKPWLGCDRDSVFDGLVTAYGAAMELRRAAGLSFVVAPLASRRGSPAERIDERHSVAIFEHVGGQAGHWGGLLAPRRREVVAMLAALHRSTCAAEAVRVHRLEVPARAGVEAALGDLNRPWDGGPFAELARTELALHAELIDGWLAELDRLEFRLNGADAELVITHGEPHPGNLITTCRGLALVDWDTVAVSRPERDLWMLDDGTGAVNAVYRDLTDVDLDPDAFKAYRLLWALSDVAAFTLHLRAAHHRDADAEKAITALHQILSGPEPSPYGLPIG